MMLKKILFVYFANHNMFIGLYLDLLETSKVENRFILE